MGSSASPPPPAAGVTRRSIAVYFYTDDLGGEARDPSHSTMYIQRPLPQRFREGYQIEAADVRYLRDLLFRRDHQIDFLYEREKEFSRDRGALQERLRQAEKNLEQVKRDLEDRETLQEKLHQAVENLKRIAEVLRKTESSWSFRIGRAVTWPLRLLRGG
jgi:flagellar motility protein MotE (MotC chaperone)